MMTTKFGEVVLSESDLCNIVMQGRDVLNLRNVIVDNTVDVETLVQRIENPHDLLTWTFPADSNISVPEFDKVQQGHWFMPEAYKNLDIAEYVLDLCKTDAQLQRVGNELLMFQERNMFDLLKYLKYLVDIMRENNVIWGVGRGSSVASYVLYLMGVHRIDSMYYDLDPSEFLR